MKSLFLPTAKNNYKAYLLKLPVLLVFVLIISSFNFLIKIDTHAESTDNSITAENLLSAHNQKRLENNLGTLRMNASLTTSAQQKAQKMLESNCWSHYCPDGESPWDFFKNADYDYVLAGENLAEGYYYLDDLMTAWMNSQTHRDNILNADYREVGFGIVSGNYQGIQNNIIVVVHFGTQPADLMNNNEQLTITSPVNGTVLPENHTPVEGSVSGLSKVNIYLNGGLSGNANIKDGLFTYSLENLKVGDNYIYAQSPLEFGLAKESNTVKVTFDNNQNALAASKSTQPISINFNGLTSSAEIKNSINLVFIIGLGLLFLLDFLVLSRTHILTKERSYAHYHFGLLFIVGLIILAGGFSGSIMQAVNI